MRIALLVVLSVVVAGCPGGSGGSTGSTGDPAGSGSSSGGAATSGTGGSSGTATSGTATSGTATSTTSSGPITVVGKVVDTLGAPASGVTVVILGKPSTITDAMGAFSVPGVTPPYDAATVAVAGPLTFVTVAPNISRGNPTLVSLGATSLPNEATITGDLSGGGVTLPAADRGTRAWFTSPEASASASVDANPYSLEPSWMGQATSTGTVHALQWTKNAGGAPLDYVAYGKLENVLIANGTTATMKNVTMTMVEEQLLSGTVTVPADFAVSSKRFSIQLGAGPVFLTSEVTNAASFAFATPVITGATFYLSVEATGSGTAMGRRGEHRKPGIAGNATGVGVTVPTPPGLSLPVQGASGIALATQTFSWSAMSPAGMYVLQLGLGMITVSIVTEGTSARVPSTTELGLGTIASGTPCTWRVSAFAGGTATTVDAAVGVDKPYLAIVPAVAELDLGDSEQRTFMTQ